MGTIIVAPTSGNAQPSANGPTTSTLSNAHKFDATRCRAIADLSSKSLPSFSSKDNGEWECTYLLEYPETGHAPSLFIQIRGFEPGQWKNFRLKLNFGSLLSRQVLGKRAANLVYMLVGEQTPIRQMDATLAEGREFELSFEGITLRYKRELFDTSRFNLFGTIARDCGSACP
ncbi:hypothetical protein G6L28_15100 [Agrobacterium larrymoorei]|uniref:DUF6030 family protein n=1 Tax=Agrobacterium larrymoorei TaxID=160699 RepID=UPI0015729CDD|nr:DUF6030 family protein [Agrobacterium larrymoorei]NTJ43927.1 hypothetical protein [Agrobacterium larrymoorei]